MLQWYYLVLLSSVTMGVATILEKGMLRAEHATAYSAAFSLIIAGASLLIVPFGNFNIPVQALALLFVVSLLATATYLYAARLVKHGQITVSSTAFSSAPAIFIVVLAYLFIGERPTYIQYVSIIGITVLTFLMLFGKGDRPFDNPKYSAVVFLYSALSATGTVITRYLLNTIDPYATFVIVNALMAAEFFVYISYRYGGLKEIVSTIRQAKLPMFSMVLLTMAYRLSYLVALAAAPVSISWPLRNTVFIVITVVAGGMLFGEKKLPKKLALSLAALFFAYLLVTGG